MGPLYLSGLRSSLSLQKPRVEWGEVGWIVALSQHWGMGWVGAGVLGWEVVCEGGGTVLGEGMGCGGWDGKKGY